MKLLKLIRNIQAATCALGIAYMLAIVGSMLVAVGCSTAPNTVEGMNNLESQARATLARVEQRLPEPKSQYVGYAVFPDVGEGAVGIGGAYGKGVVFENGKVVGYTDMTQGSLGWQLGGKTFKEVIVFRDAESLQRFKSGNFEFDAKANVIASDSAAGVAARTVGTMVYLLDKDGLMFSASVGGQKFGFVPKS